MALTHPLMAPAGLGPGDHVAWAVDGQEALRAAVVPYFREGVARAERMIFVGEAPDESLAGLSERDELVDRGQLRLSSPDDNYRLVVSGDVWGQANDLQQEADRAVCDGYTGIRVWADVTSLAGDQALLQHLLDYETATEAMFRRWPVTGLCALDVTLVPEEWSRFASRHLFRRRWGDTADLAVTLFDNVVCLVGEVDVSSVAELQDSLASVERTTAGDLVVDLTGLEFLDVAGTRALASFAGRLGSRDRCVRLVGARGVAARVLGLFGLDGCAEV